ncbi:MULTISPECIES: hypothetical protein [unclassified Pseudomonas]|uniref:hypothetical protein n=1 Tax=unclassified Pseudomonas TaxID=196821 RepID=UPI000D3CD6CB|nr:MULTISPECIES: hypothetical protein [unclassified Pseudomonas]RAU43690.1 hypothetical protein DBP26_019370 [Pseudomonas sp. RIT 409]RAU54378.1 hypothetical protein DBY65_008600 [Pseudomonas sp. RIT 412]
MYIFEIVVPGIWIDLEDRGLAWRTEGLLRSLQSQFFEANLALNLFEEAQSAVAARFPDRDAWFRDSQRRAEIQQALEVEVGGMLNRELMDQIRFQSEVIFKRERWASGVVPRELQHRIPFVHARTFLYALDSFDKLLNVLAKEPGAPSALTDAKDEMARLFPTLREVRNSAHHIEDRLRYLGKYNKPLDLKPVNAGGIRAPGGALILDNLNGSRYGATMVDGHFGEVDVSNESMEGLQAVLNNVYRAYPWKGPKQHLPSV